MKRLLLLLTILIGLPAAGSVAAEQLTLCYHYGCDRQGRFDIRLETLQGLAARFAAAADAADEREAVREAIRALYADAARLLPIWQDKAGNGVDDSGDGRMDCIDHSENAVRMLDYLARHHWLRFHAPAGIVSRAPWLVNYHQGAALEETASRTRWVVDGWFYDFGALPAVVPLDVWKKGFSP